MKKNLIILAGMAVLISAVSCSIEENKIDPIPADPRVPMTFTAGEFTKTSLDPDKENAVYWSEGDAISIFDGTNNNEFTLTDGASTASAKFEGEAVPDQPYYALYPYSETASLSGTTITSSLPAEQQYVGATFDTMLNPSVAVADENNNLAFHNVASILQINVSELQSKSVREIQISADKSLTGEYTVAMSNPESYAAVAASGTEISGLRLLVDSADMETDQNFNGSISCYAVVLPGTYANLKISVIYSDNSYSEKSFENVTLAASDGNYVNVDASQATANDRGLYGLFMAGQDIYIGGKAYNKSQFTDEQIIHYTASTSSAITDNNYGTGNIIFVDSDVSGTTSNGTLGPIRNVIIVGNDPVNKPTLRKNNSFIIKGDGDARAIFANIKFDLTPLVNQAFSFSIGADVVCQELVFDDCDIVMFNNHALIGLPSLSNGNSYTTGDAVGSLVNLVITNCNITIPAGSTNALIFSSTSNPTDLTNVIFENNIFDCSGDGIVQTFRLINSANNSSTQTNIEKIFISNNTFINIVYDNSAAVIARNIEQAMITKNLLYINKSLVDVSNAYHSMLRVYEGTYPAIANCVDNIAYYDRSLPNGLPDPTEETPNPPTRYYFRIFNNNTFTPATGSAEEFDLLDTDPFEGGDLSTFTPAPEYASYGAQR